MTNNELKRKEKTVTNSQHNRVLCRQGARYLNEEELKIVVGNGHVTTDFCTFDPRTGNRDGDCD